MDATNGNDADPGTSRAQAWQTIAKVNGETFRPTDHIRLQGLFREQLTVPSSGIAGKPITFGVYGSGAIINGADIITGWAAYGAGAGSTWQSALATECNQVFMDDVKLTEGADEDNLNDHEWFWVGNVLYVRDETGDPDGSVVIEASQRTNCIDWDEQDYVTVDGIVCQRTEEQCIKVTGNHFVLRNAEAYYSYIGACIIVWGSSDPVVAAALGLATVITGGKIDSCIVSGAPISPNVFVGLEPDLEGPAGVIVQYTESYGSDSHGLYFGAGLNNTLFRNHCHDNAGAGLKLNSCTYCTAYENYCHDNEYGLMLSENEGPCNNHLVYNNWIQDCVYSGIVITNDSANGCDDNEFYHNTFVNASTVSNFRGIVAFGAAGHTGNVFKNNVFYNDAAHGWLLRFPDGAEEGNQTFDNNIYYKVGVSPGGDIIYDGAARTFAAWQGFGQDANGDEDNPDFVTEYTDLHLLVGSPCIGAGAVGTGVTDDYDGVTRGSPPDCGAYEYVPPT